MSERVLVTGATGFVGSSLIERLHRSGMYAVRGTARKRPGSESPLVEIVEVGDLSKETDWSHSLAGIDVVVHTAAKVHGSERALDSVDAYRRVNVQGTLGLARAAAEKGVRRFIFISSIKVNGDTTTKGRPFCSDDPPAPIEAYGLSKLEAEDGLWKLATGTGLELVVIRPCLVYGPGVKANFLTMMQWLARGVPLPLAAVDNKRSFVALENLVDLLSVCIDHPAAVNQTFLVADGEDLSTPELLCRTAAALGKRARLFYVPLPVLTAASILTGKGELTKRLCGSLQVDISRNQSLLGWMPPVKVDQALLATAQHFLNEAR